MLTVRHFDLTAQATANLNGAMPKIWTTST